MKILRTPLVIVLMVLAGRVFVAKAQTVTILYSFGSSPTDGYYPRAGLVEGSDSNFYGTTWLGGTSTDCSDLGCGTVFRISSNDTYTSLYSFGSSPGDGRAPLAGLVQGSDGNFYGTTQGSGTNNWGSVFQISPSGTETNLYTFGSYLSPAAGLVQGSDGNFYGTTQFGGTSTNGGGTVFRISPSGSYTNLHFFAGSPNDGSEPLAGLVQGSDSNFYGTTDDGGMNDCAEGCGTVFRISPSGTYTSLYSFGSSPSDGVHPLAGLVQGSDSNFYGTTSSGGTNSCYCGTVFRISPSGSETTLYSFAGYPNDGGEPVAGLVQGSDGSFYGTTSSGGTSTNCGASAGCGTVFRISPGGTETTLYSFGSSPNDGATPLAGLVQGSDGNLYGTTSDGGTNSCACGTVFKVCTFALNPTKESFAAAGGSDIVNVTASNGCAWTAGTTTSWITITSGTNGTGGGTISYSVAANTSSIELTGTIIIAGQTFTVTEGGVPCTYSINPTNGVFVAAGDVGSVSVTAPNGCAWTASTTNSWITITAGSSGSGNGTVAYTVAANTNTAILTGTMAIAGQTFTVTQSGGVSPNCTYTLNATRVTLAAKGGLKNVSVKVKGTDCSWTAVSNDPFITITSGSTGTGNGKVDYTVPGNTNSTALSGTMTIADQTFTVNQAAGGCPFKLSPKDRKFKAGGGTGIVKVTPNLSDCAWTAVSNDSFVTITDGTSGVGKGTVSYTVAANTNTTALTGSITIAGETFTITQSGEK